MTIDFRGNNTLSGIQYAQEVIMEEFFCSGYCRRIDASRMVAVEVENGQLWVDCDYGSCPYQDTCPIAIQISQHGA